jgi:hypothetical protein
MLRVFKKRALKKIFGPKWEVITGDSRKWPSKEFRDFTLTKY